MKKEATGLQFVVAVMVVGVFVGAGLASAQDQSQASVVHATAHGLSAPLRDTVPIPPQPGLGHVIPLRHPFPIQAAAQLARDPALQTSPGPFLRATSAQTFPGVGVGLGSYSDCCAPPDTNGAAGATQFVQWVNLDFAVFSKTNGSLVYGPAAGNTLWQSLGGACAAKNSGDPIAQYDKQAGRWVMMQPVFTSPYYLCVAVSTTSDATGTYNLYQFAIPNNTFPDYPKLGVWPDGYYVSYNQFQGGSFVGAAACALDRNSMLSGTSATMQCFSTGYASLLPSDLDGASGAPGTTSPPTAGAPNYFLNFTSNALNLWKFHVDWTTPSNSTFTGPVTVQNVSAFAAACNGGACIPQSQTRQLLDSLGDRVMYRLAYRNFGTYESLVVTHSVATGSGNTGARWYEIRSPGATPTVYQQGTYAPDSSYRWMGSIAQDKVGDMGLGYSVSSSIMFPAIRYTGRTPSDPLGSMGSETSIVEGTGSQLRNLSRWGDYSSMAIDPTDDCTFWYTSEYLLSNGTFNWSTQIASFSFPGCASPSPSYSLSASPTSQTVTQGSGAGYTISVNPSGGFTGNVDLSVTTPLPAGVTVTFNPTPVSVTGTSSVSSTMSVTTSSLTPAGTYTLTVMGTSGSLSSSTNVTLVVNAASTGDFSISASPPSQSITRGSSTTYAVTVAASGGFNGTVSLSVSGLPPRTSASFNPSSVTGSGSSTLTVSTRRSAVPGSYTLTITGTSGSLTHSTSVTLVIN